MKRVLVVGEKRRVEEFQRLQLQHAEVTFRVHPDLSGFDGEEDMIDEEWTDEIEASEEEGGVIANFMGGNLDEESDFEDDDAYQGYDDEEDNLLDDTDGFDIIFDLNFEDGSDNIVSYALNEGQIVFVGAVTKTLSSMIGPWQDSMLCRVFGLNAWPTFIDRPKLEVSMMDPADHMVLEATLKTLGLDYELVEDEVGMVGPRVVSMIINEAAYVLGEGTADVLAIDQAMKLGTNYPKGPFEWCDAIGVERVVELIQALQDSTGDGRYKLAPRLRRQADRFLNFYPEDVQV